MATLWPESWGQFKYGTTVMCCISSVFVKTVVSKDNLLDFIYMNRCWKLWILFPSLVKLHFQTHDSDGRPITLLFKLYCRWLWLLATLTDLLSLWLSPGCATCCSAPRLVVRTPMTIITLLQQPPLPPHLQPKPRRNWAKALVRGNPRKLSKNPISC